MACTPVHAKILGSLVISLVQFRGNRGQLSAYIHQQDLPWNERFSNQTGDPEIRAIRSFADDRTDGTISRGIPIARESGVLNIIVAEFISGDASRSQPARNRFYFLAILGGRSVRGWLNIPLLLQ